MELVVSHHPPLLAGIALLTGVALYVVFEVLPVWVRLSAVAKRWMFAVACLGLPILVAAIRTPQSGWGPFFDNTLLPALAYGAFAFMGGTLAHSEHLYSRSLAMDLGRRVITYYRWALISPEDPTADPQQVAQVITQMVGSAAYLGR